MLLRPSNRSWNGNWIAAIADFREAGESSSHTTCSETAGKISIHVSRCAYFRRSCPNCRLGSPLGLSRVQITSPRGWPYRVHERWSAVPSQVLSPVTDIERATYSAHTPVIWRDSSRPTGSSPLEQLNSTEPTTQKVISGLCTDCKPNTSATQPHVIIISFWGGTWDPN